MPKDGPLQPPSQRVTVRHCVFRNIYGRGVALYNTTDSEIVGCLFRDVADEAIDFDHFTYRCRAVGNDIRRAVFGVTINDGSTVQSTSWMQVGGVEVRLSGTSGKTITVTFPSEQAD